MTPSPWLGPMPPPKVVPPPAVRPAWRRALSAMYRGWMKFAHVLAWINTRILLGFVFFVFLTPIRLAMWPFRRDPLQRRPDRKRATYWTERKPDERVRPAEDYENQY